MEKSETGGTTQQKQHVKKEAYLDALEKSLGIVSQAAKKVGIDRTTPYRWMREDEEFKERCQEIENVVLDFAETKLFEMVHDGNPTAVIFLLKTRGKKRGYIERHEITGADGTGLDVKIEVVNSITD